MITINNSIELLTALINEAYKENGEVWDKVLILRFPKNEFSLETATELATKAETVTNVTKEKILEYHVTDILKTDEDGYFIDIWMKNPDVVVSDNPVEKVAEQQEMLDIITEGAMIDESTNEG